MDDDPVPRAVLRILPRDGTGLTMRTIARYTGFGYLTVRRAMYTLKLASLVKRGRDRHYSGRGGVPWEWRRT
jgi:DNA-binding IclR family transcriptional regulator